MYTNVCIKHGNVDNIIYYTYENLKLNLYELYQNILISIRDFLDDIIDHKVRLDDSNINFEEPKIRKVNINNSESSNPKSFKVLLEEKDLSPSNRESYKSFYESRHPEFQKPLFDGEEFSSKNNEKHFYDSRYFLIGVIITGVVISTVLIYYNYQHIIDYFSRNYRPGGNIPPTPQHEEIKLEPGRLFINPDEELAKLQVISQHSSPSSSVSSESTAGSDITVKKDKMPSISPVDRSTVE
jgi:hypothetical protein